MKERAEPLDRFDLAILDCLQKDNKRPQRSIAEAIGLSAPAVQRRFKRLEEDGTILAHAAIVDPAGAGRALTRIVEVEMASERRDAHDAARRAFADAPEIQRCYYVTGEADFILVLTVATMADYEALTRRLFFDNANVKRFKTFVAMDRVKVGLGAPAQG